MKSIQFSVTLILLFSLCSRSLSAQVFVQQANRKAQKWYERSAEYYAERKMDKVEEGLLNAIAAEPEFVDAMLRLADLYYQQQQFKKAVHWYDKATQLAPGYRLPVYYTYGYALWELNRFAEAQEAFSKYAEQNNLTTRKRREVEGILRNCAFADSATKNPVPFVPRRLSDAINTQDHEYLPSFTADLQYLYFTRRKGLLEDIYKAKQITDTSFALATPLSQTINTPAYGEGAATISPDGKTLFFTADYGGNGQRGWDIYQSSKTPSGWTKPQILPVPVNTLFYESQPSVSADGQSLYFVSRRKGGMGGKDIWVAHLNEDCVWGTPKNLGSTINTFADEEVPFIHADGQTLYFGSNGHVGMGGSDLYMSRKQPDGSWSSPVNLGYPINTKSNEGSLTVTPDGQQGYFTSDQFVASVNAVERNFDLFTFQLHPAIRPKPVTYVDITIVDAITRQPLDAEFELFNLLDTSLVANSGCQQYLKDHFLITLPTGIDYALHISKPGYLFHSEHFTLTAKDSFAPVRKVIPLQPIQKGASITLNNLLFATDSDSILPASRIELQKVVQMMKENPDITITIAGHTDSIGDEAYNLQLSKHRAEAVATYLIRQQIARQRLNTIGYGETRPVAPNDSPQGRARNRRTTITIE